MPSTSSRTRGLHNSLMRAKAAAALKTPPPDMKSRRRNEADEAAKALDRLNKTAKAVMEKISCDKPAREDDACLGMVNFALDQVPKDKLLPCMMDILKVANIYQKGGTPKVVEE